MIRRNEFRISDFGFRIIAAPRIRNPQSAIRNGWYGCLLVILLLAGTISARYGNPPTAGAISRGTVPPSSYRSALLNTPDPLDHTSSLAVTGNAGGGKSFRGPIPYGSTTSFGSRLGSTALDPFLRYSALPEESTWSPSAAGSFYSPTGTVSKMEPGSTGLFAPGSPRIAAGVMQSAADQAVNTMLAPEAPRFRGLAGRSFTSADATAGAWVSSFARTPEEMRRIVVGEPDTALADREPARQTRQMMTAQEYQRQVEQLQRDLDGIRSRASDFEHDLGAGRQPSVTTAWAQRPGGMPLPPISSEDVRRIIEPESPTPPLSAVLNPPAGQDLSFVPPAPIPDRPVAPGLGELSLVPSGSSLAGPRPEVFRPSRPAPNGPSSSPMPSSSEMAAQLKRIDSIFTPQTDRTTALKSNESDNKLPALQRVDDLMQTFAAPGKPVERPVPDAPGSLLSSMPDKAAVALSPEDVQASVRKAIQPSKTPPKPPDPGRLPLPGAPGSLSSSTPDSTAVALPPEEVQASVRNAIQPSKTPPKSPDPGQSAPPDRPASPAAPPAPLDPAAQARLETYLKSAQSEMQQGQYARAAESFALACIYNPRDARPQLGRSHALLAGGEYLGSAVCLAKAIELDPRLSLAELDLIETLGGPDRFLQRINDLEERAKSSTAPGLQLLLAYIYHQMKAPEKARTAIQAAKEALPSSLAIDLLERAIASGSPG